MSFGSLGGRFLFRKRFRTVSDGQVHVGAVASPRSDAKECIRYLAVIEGHRLERTSSWVISDLPPLSRATSICNDSEWNASYNADF